MPRFMLFSSKMLRSLRVEWVREPEGSLDSMRVPLLSHSFNTNAPFVGEKDKDLVGWVFIGCRKEVKLISTANQRGRARSVFPIESGQESNALYATHLIRVQLPELREVHLDFFVRDLESLVNKKKCSQV